MKHCGRGVGDGGASGEKISEAMEGACSENKDAQFPLPPWLLQLPRAHMIERGVAWHGWSILARVFQMVPGDSDIFLSPREPWVSEAYRGKGLLTCYNLREISQLDLLD